MKVLSNFSITYVPLLLKTPTAEINHLVCKLKRQFVSILLLSCDTNSPTRQASLRTMVSLSLGISFSGLLHFMLDYFAESVVLVLSQLIASDAFETQTFDSLKLLREFPPRKNIELASSEMELDSELKNSNAASNRSEHARKIDVSADSIKKQEHQFSSFQNEGAPSSSKQALNQSGAMVSNPRKRVCSNSSEGKAVLQGREAEDLNTRLKILEEESEIMKQALLETVVERKKLINEMCQLLETLYYTILKKDEEDGYGSLVIKPPSRVFQFEP